MFNIIPNIRAYIISVMFPCTKANIIVDMIIATFGELNFFKSFSNIYLNNINLQIYRYIILGIGLSTMAWGIFKKKTQYLYFALGIVVIAEVIGRYTFYNIH